MTTAFQAASDAGCVREHNEDRWNAQEEAGIFVVADGMGGHAAGEVAARICVEALPVLLHQAAASRAEQFCAEQLQAAIVKTSRRVREAAQNPEFGGMGAALVALWVEPASDGCRAYIGHLGDCRAYLWRDGQLEALTRDHSLVELMLQSGDLTPEAALTHPSRHQITQFCGMDGTALPDVRELQLRPGDKVLLCSDGVCNELDEAQLSRLCAQEAAATAIVQAALEAGGRDNATALIVSFD